MIAQIQGLSQFIYKEKTFQNSISCVGVGLHSGAKVHMTLKPAPIGTGIVFKRVDVKDKNNLIPALYSYVSDAQLCTCLGNEVGVKVSTVEHLMATFSGFGITNAYVELDGPEVPLMDGSANDFVTLFECAGMVEQDAPLKALKIKKEVVIQDKDGVEVSLSPAEIGLDLNFMIDFKKSKVIGRQEYSIVLSERSFKESLAYARTFGFAKEVETLREMGLIKGGTLENAIVVNGDTVVNPEGLRSENEFVIHKTLDAVGDLYQVGYPIIGYFSGVKSGHSHTNALLKAVFENAENYEWVELDTYMKQNLNKKKISA